MTSTIDQTARAQKRLEMMSAKRAGCDTDEAARRLAAGERVCARCREWHPCAHFGAMKRGGFYSYCAGCSNANGREHFAKRMKRRAPGEAAALVDAARKRGEVSREEWPARSGTTRIGCLQCRHARVALETNWAQTKPFIWCEKSERVRPIAWTHCSLADPRPAQPHALHRFWIKLGPLGDKCRHATPLFEEFLRAMWPRLSAARLEQVTGRTMNSLHGVALRLGLGAHVAGGNRLHFAARGRGCFTPAQTRFLSNVYGGPHWPKAANTRCHPDELAQRKAAQEAVVRAVAKLNPDGPRFSWEQIKRHCAKQRSLVRGRASVLMVNAGTSVPGCNKARAWK